MLTWPALRAQLTRSAFRRRFRLDPAAQAYVRDKGLAVIRRHAQNFVRTRLAPAQPPNDGRQTPMRGHPVFVAQHATATCCRRCLHKWHGIPAGAPLSEAQTAYIVGVLLRWIQEQMEAAGADVQTPPQRRQLGLFDDNEDLHKEGLKR